ncbi:hypothetical protein ASPWEDRAFT_33273 [Aspergillus wentii DTO 134E9]|uniref:Uncharacterized protein n=1 Tax=Aspergillus wentii DTO 134E9 TaxID=1073089 RepID=A0A1L9R3X9_ASPWE|nr:uncharacterized protein ASPWEDRAFT_33273 [Aspergillus wentii DTO 134E9]OJJ29629.1 hypothetical protein ASPWEDRAFT_33273 [Aspergillus wentii DTO 134E9]
MDSSSAERVKGSHREAPESRCQTRSKTKAQSSRGSSTSVPRPIAHEKPRSARVKKLPNEIESQSFTRKRPAPKLGIDDESVPNKRRRINTRRTEDSHREPHEKRYQTRSVTKAKSLHVIPT